MVLSVSIPSTIRWRPSRRSPSAARPKRRFCSQRLRRPPRASPAGRRPIGSAPGASPGDRLQMPSSVPETTTRARFEPECLWILNRRSRTTRNRKVFRGVLSNRFWPSAFSSISNPNFSSICRANLSRPMTRVEDTRCLLSWSGSMFEQSR